MRNILIQHDAVENIWPSGSRKETLNCPVHRRALQSLGIYVPLKDKGPKDGAFGLMQTSLSL